MVEAVVWDIGNVLGYWEPERYYDARIGREARERFFAETGIEAVNETVDLGAPLRETIYAHAERHATWSEEIRAWADDWRAMFTRPVEGSAEVFAEVKATGISVFALSNFGTETLEMAKEIHPVLTGFDREFVSAHLRCIKPDPLIYSALEDGTGLSGASLLFADDKPENIQAAEARGWKGHLFEGAYGWRARLVAEGVLAS